MYLTSLATLVTILKHFIQTLIQKTDGFSSIAFLPFVDVSNPRALFVQFTLTTSLNGENKSLRISILCDRIKYQEPMY